MLYKQIKSEYQRINNQITFIKNELQNLPPGKLLCCTHQKYTKWYQNDGTHTKYISKKNQTLAEKLAQKKYLSALLQDLEKEKLAIEFYLRHHTPPKAEILLTQPSEYQRLLAPHFSPLSKELSDWMHAPYERNTTHPENLIFKNISGNTVRSKSEMMIDMCLSIHQIPFRYECVLQLGDTVLHPDFTIRHPTNGKYYYWEHFGLMDNPGYSDNAIAKLQLYTSHGIIPGIHLIITSETKEEPLDTQLVQTLIEHYFS
ncbi:MAG: ATPase [Lachnospiraceae bacterium]|nr:ATPase [Lachnospiraceae bacterium]